MSTDHLAQIPPSIDAVTDSWLSSALHASGALPTGSRVGRHNSTRIGQGSGLMGEIYRLALEFVGPSGSAPQSVVVKLPSAHEGSRAQGVALGMYDAEVRFYRELAPRPVAYLPTVYHASNIAGTAEFVIVMQDLSHLSTVDQIAGMKVEQAAACARVLADVHARWWDRVKVRDLEWVPTTVGDRITMVDHLLSEIWPAAAATIGQSLPPGGLELGAAFSHSYLALQQGFASRPWTLLHQDFRVDNLMLGDSSSDDVVIIDWQGIGRGPAGYDLAYLLAGSMTVDDRRAYEADLVAHYQRRLADHGVDYSYEQIWQDYSYAHALGGLAVTIVAAATLDTTDPRSRDLVACMAERHFTAALDFDCNRLIS